MYPMCTRQDHDLAGRSRPTHRSPKPGRQLRDLPAGSPHLPSEEGRHLGGEVLRVLEEEGVAGVAVADEGRVRQVLDAGEIAVAGGPPGVGVG